MPKRSSKQNHEQGDPAPATAGIDKLHLDLNNPRLPESVLGKSEREILEYLHREGTLLELAESFLDNKYLPDEPLIGVRRQDGEIDVIEGNRRLATLLILLNRPIAKGLRLDVAPTQAQLKELDAVPVRVVANRDAVRPFVGFRHIGGLKKWPAESKARYVFQEVESLAKQGDSEPFKTLGRRVGSRAGPMRASYASIALLRQARDEEDFDYQPLVDERRFGVWLRAYDAVKVREYIGFGNPVSYREVKRAVQRVNTRRVVEILRDLLPDGELPPVLDDSRDISVYADVLADTQARRVLRETRNLDAARLLVVDEGVEVAIRRLIRQIDVLSDKAAKSQIVESMKAAADELFGKAKVLRAVIHRVDE